MKENKRILLVYSTAGLGHKKAALALEKKIKDTVKACDVKAVDIMEYATGFYRFIYLELYVFMMKKATWLWALMFYISDFRPFDVLTRRLRGILDNKGVPGFTDLLEKEKPDAVIATHFLVPSIAGIIRKKGIKTLLSAVVTDYGPHSYWLSKHMDMYFAGGEIVRSELIRKGISPEKITVTGIPVMPEFSAEKDIEGLKREYGLESVKKTIFVMSGGFGVGPFEKMLKELESVAKNGYAIQVIAVCGHNKALYEELSAASDRFGYDLKVFGFTDKVAELMAVSDIMVTKAGGISVTEAVDSALPMILYGSIPGQETWNEEYLSKAAAALRAGSISEIPRMIERMICSDEEYEKFRAALRNIRKPEAARDITTKITELAEGS